MIKNRLKQARSARARLSWLMLSVSVPLATALAATFSSALALASASYSHPLPRTTDTTAASPASASRARAAEVVLKDKTRLYAFLNPGEPSGKTFVFVNGLIWDIKEWDRIAEGLNAQGHTVIRYAMRLQPESLRLLAPGETPAALRRGITLAELADELAGVIQAFKLSGTPLQLVGLSYGAAVAAEFAARHPKMIANTVLMAPLIVPLDSYDANGAAIRQWLRNVRYWENSACDMYGGLNPTLCARRDYWFNAFYDYIYGSFLGRHVSQTPPDLDAVLYKKSLFHLVRAVRELDLTTYAGKLPNLHLLVAANDERNLLKDQLRLWERVPGADKRSLTVVTGAGHRLPQDAPKTSTTWLHDIALEKPEMQNGQTHRTQAN